MDNKEDANTIMGDILEKFKKIPNTGLMQIWLQRIAIPFKSQLDFSEPICGLIEGDSLDLWDSTWLHSKLKTKLKSLDFIIQDKIDELSPVMSMSEISIFEYDDNITETVEN